MDRALQIIGVAMVIGFGSCCLASALLQLLAWSRHRVPEAPVSMRALWKPEGHFDEVGLRQMHVARRLILLGAVMYLSYGVLMFAVSQVSLGR